MIPIPLSLAEFLEAYRSRKHEQKAFQIICQENNISYKKLRPYLKEIGFSYDRKSFDYALAEDQKDSEADLLLADLPSLFPMRKDAQHMQSAGADPEDLPTAITAADMKLLSAIDDQLDKEKRAIKKAAKQQQQIVSDSLDQKLKRASAEATPQPQIIADQLFDIVDLLQQINNKLPAAHEAAAAMIKPQAIEKDLLDHDSAPLALQLHLISQSDKTRKTINISAAAGSWLDKFSATKGYKIGDLVTLAVMQLKERIDPPDYEGK